PARRAISAAGRGPPRPVAPRGRPAPAGGLQRRGDRRSPRLQPPDGRAEAGTDPPDLVGDFAPMSAAPAPEPLPLTLVDRVDRACDAFEAAWRAGPRPRLEDFLGELPEPGRSALLRELLAAELELRRASGERPTPDEYSPRFPD